MSETVKDHSAVLVRLLCALNGYRAKYEEWPEAVALEASALAALVTAHLTPLGLYRLQSKVELREGAVGDVVAYGRKGQQFSYSKESGHEAEPLALQWLQWEIPPEG